MRRILGFALLTSLVLFACDQAEEPQDATPSADDAVDEAAAVRAVAESWDPISNAEDVDGMMGLFTANPIRLNAGEPALVGTEACRADFAVAFANSNSEGYNPVDEVQVAGSWAFARGTFLDKTTSEETGEVTEERGKWLSIFRKTPEGWKFHLDAWNRDAPATNVDATEATARGELPPELSPSGPAEEAVVALGEAWDEANNAEDVEALLGLYTQDAIRMNADEPLIQGTEALRMDFEDAFAAQKPDGSGPILGLEIEGDWAYMWGTWTDHPTLKETGETLEDSGKWLNVLRSTPEGWKIYVEIWNRDAPQTSG